MFAIALIAVTLTAPGASVERAGITAPVPTGWRVIDRRLTPCTNPLERLTLAGPGGAMVMLQESLDPRHYVARFDERPRHWRLRGSPQPIACCAPSRRPGWFMNFRDAGRGFYVYVYATTTATRRTALTILDRLTVTRRHG
jgi:hypothetical protein